MLESTIKNILFDLDGTLIESEKGIINSILYSIEKLDLKQSDRETLRSFIGPPLIESYIDFFDLNREDAHHAVNVFREYFSEKGVLENHLYEGVFDLLNSLKNLDLKLYLATSKPTFYAEKILKHHKIHHLFVGIIGSNMDHTRVDKTEIISYLIENFKIRADESLMVGDRKFDIIGAKDNNVSSAAVLYGHGSLSELEEVKPDYIFKKPVDILTLFN